LAILPNKSRCRPLNAHRTRQGDLDCGVILARWTGLDYTFDGAAVVVEGVTVAVFATKATTMLVIGLLLSGFAIGLFCWLILRSLCMRCHSS